METFSALLAICAGNSPVSGEFPAQRPVTQSFDVFFDVRVWVNTREAGHLRRYRIHYDVIVMNDPRKSNWYKRKMSFLSHLFHGRHQFIVFRKGFGIYIVRYIWNYTLDLNSTKFSRGFTEYTLPVVAEDTACMNWSWSGLISAVSLTPVRTMSCIDGDLYASLEFENPLKEGFNKCHTIIIIPFFPFRYVIQYNVVPPGAVG